MTKPYADQINVSSTNLRSVADKLGDVVSVKDFGALGDGVTDDTAAILAAYAAAPVGSSLQFEPGSTYKITGPIGGGNVYKTIGNGATLKPTAAAFSSDGSLLTLGKLLTAYTGFTTFSAVTNTSVVTLPTGVTAEVGDLLKFESTDVRVTGYNHGMYARVTSIVGQVANLSCSFYSAFTVTGINRYRGYPTLEISGLKFDLSAAPNNLNYVNALSVIGTNVKVIGCEFVGNSYACVGVDAAGDNIAINGNSFSNFLNVQGVSPGLPSRVGYGVNVSGNNLNVFGNTFSRCKHSVTGGDRSAVSVNVDIHHNHITEDFSGTVDDYKGAIDMHSNVSGPYRVHHNYVTAHSTVVNVRSEKCTISDNVFIQSTAAGNVINNGELGIDGLIINANRIFMCSSASALLSDYAASPSNYFKNISIFDNHITTGSVFKSGVTSTVIENMSIRRNNVPGNHLFYVSGTGLSMSNIDVSDNVSSGGHVFYASGTSLLIGRVKVNGNTSVATGLLTISNTSATAMADIECRGNKYTVAAGVNTDNGVSFSSGYLTKGATFKRIGIKDNLIDMTGRDSNATALNFNDAIFNVMDVVNNVIIRGPSNTFRNVSCTRGDYSDVTFSGNRFDGDFNLANQGVFGYASRIKIVGNTITNITLTEGTLALTINDLVISGNSVSGGVNFAGAASSTSWSSGGEAVVSNNVFSTGTLSINFDNNKVRAYGNTFKTALNDTSANNGYYAVPLANAVLTGSITWKGATKPTYTGDLIKTSIPTTGSWVIGDRVFNSAPAVGQPKSWVRITTGSGNVLNTDWVSEGNL